MACRLIFRKRTSYKTCLVIIFILYMMALTVLLVAFKERISRMPSELNRSFGGLDIKPPQKRSRQVRFFPISGKSPCSGSQLIGNRRNYVCDWLSDKHGDSTGNMVMYGREFAVLRNVLLDPSKASCRAGGDHMKSVSKQRESDEYFTLSKSYFSLRCKYLRQPPFNGRNHLNDWFGSIKCVSDNVTSMKTIPGVTVALQRYEYVNFYHTMTDFYNTFLIMFLFQIPPDNINVVFIDCHPPGGLDATWEKLFKSLYRAGHLKTVTIFPKMIWNIQGYNSPLHNHVLQYVPFLDEFRHFFLSRHNIRQDGVLDCNNLHVLFIWRRNYVAHPRNPAGVVSRKIKNEKELLNSVRKVLPGHEVKGEQLDKLSMEEQLGLIARTDILIGMHGAGLSHTLFLPNHGSVIELFPLYWSQTHRHFRMMCEWRNLSYLSWKNTNSSYEFPNKETFVPPYIVTDMVMKMHNKLCKP